MKDYLLRNNSSGGIYLGGNPFVSQPYEYFTSEILKNEILKIKLNFERATSHEASKFKEYIVRKVDKGYRKIIIDLSKIELIDSTFIGALIFSLKKLKANNGKLKLILDENNIPASFSATSLIEVFDIYYTEEAAAYSFKSVY